MVEVSPRAARRARLEANAFEVFLALACFTISLAFWVEPHYLDTAPIGQALPAIRYIWVTLLTGAWVGILWGLWRGTARIEAVGLVLLAMTAALQSVALIASVGPRGATSFVLFTAVSWACWVRVRLLMRVRVPQGMPEGWSVYPPETHE